MGNTGSKPSILKAQKENLPAGHMTTSSGNGPGGQRLYAYWRWNGVDDWENNPNASTVTWTLNITVSNVHDNPNVVVVPGPFEIDNPTIDPVTGEKYVDNQCFEISINNFF